jgi:hypothetical protein
MHKAQYPVPNTDPKFAEVLKNISITLSQLLLFQHSSNTPKDSFFMLASAHIQVIASACNLTLEQIIKIRDWVFLRTKAGNKTYRYQSIADAIYQTTMQGK